MNTQIRQATLWDKFTRPGYQEIRRATIDKPCLEDITACYHKGEEHSVAASRRVDRAKNEKIVLGAITDLGEASSEQVEDHLGWSHQGVSSRFSDLKRKGLIVPAGHTTTRSGARAGLWKVSGSLAKAPGLPRVETGESTSGK